MAHKNKWDEALTIDQAITRIRANNLRSYQWYPVKNKHGNILEIGGTNFNDNLKLKCYIPDQKNLWYANGYMNYEYCVTFNDYIHTSDGVQIDKYKSFVAFLNKNHNICRINSKMVRHIESYYVKTLTIKK